MINRELLHDAQLQKFLKEIAEGEIIFQAGTRGNAMYIILEGMVKLQYKKENVQHLVGVCGSGEVIGEKAILENLPYRHNLTATAKVFTTVLELDPANVKTLVSKVPDFYQKILRTVAERLDKANQFIGILQLPDPVDRFSAYLSYFNRLHIHKGIGPQDVEIRPSDIRLAANLDRQLVEEAFEILISHRILQKSKNAYYLADEDELLKYLPTLRERLAA